MKYRDKANEEFSFEEISQYYNEQTFSYKRNTVIELEKKLVDKLDIDSKKIFESYKRAVSDMHKKELEISFIHAFRKGTNFSL